MDGVGGCVKRSAFKHVLSGKVVISTPGGFATYANDIVNGITVITCLNQKYLKSRRKLTTFHTYIKGMQILQIHKVQRFVIKASFFSHSTILALTRIHSTLIGIKTSEMEPYAITLIFLPSSTLTQLVLHVCKKRPQTGGNARLALSGMMRNAS